MKGPSVQGWVAPGFGAVRELFRAQLDRGAPGAAVSAWRGNTCLVDLWGGTRRRGRPWERDTMVVLFSTSKGVAGTALLLARARGWLSWDDPVVRHWPEFGAGGKESVTVRQLLGHKAGLPALDQKLSVAVLDDPDRLAALLAAQVPAWVPGTAQGYHAYSLGWYESELLRRVDPARRTLGRFFAEEVAAPLGLDFHIGLPRTIPDDRLAAILMPGPLDLLTDRDRAGRSFRRAMVDGRSLTFRTFSNPMASVADRNFLALENPAFTAVGTPRSVARLYGCLAAGGAELGLGPTLADLESSSSVAEDDLVLRLPARFQLGYLKSGGAFTFGTDDRAYGTPGAGGSFGFADPGLGLGFCYAGRKFGLRLFDDPREKALRDAVFDALGAGKG